MIQQLQRKPSLEDRYDKANVYGELKKGFKRKYGIKPMKKSEM